MVPGVTAVAPAPGEMEGVIGAEGGAPPVGVALALAVDEGVMRSRTQPLRSLRVVRFRQREPLSAAPSR